MKEVNKQTYALLFLVLEMQITKGPVKSTPEWLNAGASCTLLWGRGGWRWWREWSTLIFLAYDTTSDEFVNQTPLSYIQYFSLTWFRVSCTPSWRTSLCASHMIKGISGWSQHNNRGYFWSRECLHGQVDHHSTIVHSCQETNSTGNSKTEMTSLNRASSGSL